MVRISMDCFVKRYQPDKYEQWKAGLDLAPHPEDEYVRAYGGKARGKYIGLQEYDDPDFVISRWYKCFSLVASLNSDWQANTAAAASLTWRHCYWHETQMQNFSPPSSLTGPLLKASVCKIGKPKR